VNYNNYVKDISFDENGFSSTPSLSSRSGWLIFAVFFFLAAVKFTFVAFSGNESVMASIVVIASLLGICCLWLQTKEVQINSINFSRHNYVGFSNYHIFSRHTSIPIKNYEYIDLVVDEVFRTPKTHKHSNVTFYIESSGLSEAIGVKMDLVDMSAKSAVLALAKDLSVLTGLPVKSESHLLEEHL
jgi:hypothetical protein